MEQLQKEVNGIAAKMEATGNDIKDSDEVQKATMQLMAQLSVARQKFTAFTTKEEKATETATGADAAASNQEEAADDEAAVEPPAADDNNNSDDEGKLPSHYLANNLKYQAEANVKRALAEADKIAKAMAERVRGDGKSDGDANTSVDGDGEDKTETKATEEK